MSNRLKSARTASKQGKSLTLCEYLAACGGIRLYDRQGRVIPESSNLRAMDAGLWHRAKPFRSKLLRDDEGKYLDNACEIAWEAGYFPTHRNPPEINELLNLIEEDLRTGAVYSEYDFEELERAAIVEMDADEFMAEARAQIEAMAGRRVIPAGADLVASLSGAAVYCYSATYQNRAGRAGIIHYAKAFLPGQVKHAWHKSFRTDADRDSAINQFFQGDVRI